MKTEGIQSFGVNNNKISFNSKRIFHNTVAQLSKNNAYSLSEPNQRAILNAIQELGKVSGIKNINFLMSTAAKNKYSTNIILQNPPKTNWREKLIEAAKSAVKVSDMSFVHASYWLGAIAALAADKSLNNDEKDILDMRDKLINQVNLEQIKEETIGSIRNFEENLDYFITSSETTLEHKKYVLEKLNYLMSDEYKINPQLKDKKSIAAAEIINDMAINVPGNNVPNIKAVNQKQHGVCAAISIVRKKLAYEDKPKYIDAILSELDNTPYINVYDRSALGTGKKMNVAKIPVNFNAALAKGYRIIDASSMQWMQIGNMTGFSNIAYNIYNAFDTENFDVNADSFYNARFEDAALEKAQIYYQSLIKAEDVLQSYKASKIKENIKKDTQYRNKYHNITSINKTRTALKENLSKLLPDQPQQSINILCSELTGLQKQFSNQIKDNPFSYIPNEEECMKKEKVQKYILSKTGKKLSDKDIEKIYDLVDLCNQISSELHFPTSKSKEIMKALTLYEIGTAFRYTILMSLEEDATLEGLMKDEKISYKEALIAETLDDVILSLYYGSDNDDLIMKHLSEVTGVEFESKEQAIASLVELKKDYETIMTGYIDDIYHDLTLESRRNVLTGYIDSNINLAKSGDKNTINAFSKALLVSPSIEDVVGALQCLKDMLETNDENQFHTVYQLVGNHSQLKDLHYYYDLITNMMQQDDNTQIVAEFLKVNNLPVEDNPDAVVNKLQDIQNRIAALDNFVNQCQNILKIKDKDGDILFSADPKDRIIRKLENDGTIASYKGLKKLQKHFDAIVKDRSTDEFSTRQGKLKDKSLYKFSKFEKETLKKIEDNIDPMYSYTQKEIKHLRSDLSEDLEELKRTIGVNNGNFWVTQEGHSGLQTPQEIKVLEYMTGRPHYSTEDVAEAIEKIKTSPYSGISSSSVYHNDFGMHAQYIADIAPVKIKVKDKDGNIKEVTKEVLFNDNTWGASEHENTWIDSMGLTRTDYSDQRGGTLGYITNELYRNGNLVERINGEMILRKEPEKVESKLYKKIKHPDNEVYSTPQYDSIIIDGRSPELKSIADEIHDTLFIPQSTYIQRLGLLASLMTEEEAINAIKKFNSASNGWKDTYESLKLRIFEDGRFGKQINTREDYEQLADDDYLKVILEKIALKKSYPLAGNEPNIARIRNVKDLAPLRKEQRRRALESFKYAFEKSTTFVEYLANKFSEKECNDLIEIKNRNNLEMDDDSFIDLFKSFAIKDMNKFDGSLKTSINLIVQQIEYDIIDTIKDPVAREDILEYFKKFLEDNIYFNESDINNPKISHIIKFIDREFDPEDNAQFVKIYRQLQDMTTDEFKREILPKLKREDLGIKHITGYDVLKSIQRYEEKSNRDLMNNVYYDTIVPVLNSEEYQNTYAYNKFTRASKYRPALNFNTTYRDLKNDLDMLTYSKLFNKWKDINLTKYGAYPAYPKLDYITEDLYNSNFNGLITNLRNSIELIKGIRGQKQNYKIYHSLKRYADKLSDDAILSDYQFKNISNLLGMFITINFGDDSVKDAHEAAMSAMDLPRNAQFGQYRPYFEIIDKVMSQYEKTTPKENLEIVERNNIKIINELSRQFVLMHTQERYRNKIRHGINAIVKAMISMDKNTDEIIGGVFNQFKEAHILHNPEELLQNYIKSCTKEDENGNKSELKAISSSLNQLLNRAAGYATLAHIQEILMDAMNDGQAMDAKSFFNSLSIQLSNGDFMPMGSGEIIKMMTHLLILDQQTETANMFLDKLGLNDQYVEYTSNDIDFDEIRQSIDRTMSIANNYAAFRKDLEPITTNALNDLVAGKNFDRVLNQLKKSIAKLGKEHGVDKDAIKVWLTSIDNILEILTKQPNTEPWLVYKSKIDTTNYEMDQKINSSIDSINNYIASSQTIIDMVNSVLISPGSDADKARIAMNKKYQEIIEYINNRKSDLPVQE